MKKFILLLLILVSISDVATSQVHTKNAVREKARPPKNIILLIGDGMGLSHMYAALTATCDNLNMARCEQIALVKTNSADSYITDSGAAGTALACGQKTNNGMIGMLPDSSALTSILKLAENNGLATGMVTTCDITHATPASFVANVPSRKMAEDIALQLLRTDIDVFIGGGYDRFNNREDGLSLIDSLTARDYHVVKTIPSLLQINQGKLAGLLYPKHPPKISEGRGDMLTLSTTKAIDLLNQNQEGFFLMVEGSQIDWGGHDNDMEYIISETIDFDKAVGVALDFAEKDGKTLVIITADHETGGLSNLEGNFSEGRADGKFTTTDHSAEPVILYAFGPGSQQFKGIIENTDVFRIMKELYGF